MAKTKKNNGVSKNTGANVGYEAKLWQMADALRSSMDAAEYKHVVLDESRTLAAMRDVLLPKLISGELRVKAAKRIVARAV